MTAWNWTCRLPFVEGNLSHDRQGAGLRFRPAARLRRARRHLRARLRRARPPRHQGRHQPPQDRRQMRLVPGRCDLTVNLYDWYVCIRANRVEQVWPITARGAIC